MDLNLTLSAQSLRLAPQLQRSGPFHGLMVLKNVPAKTYLRVSTEEWVILQQFETPKTVPVVLGAAIQERFCLPLSVFYELILKALRAKVLLEPGPGPEAVHAYEWNWAVRPGILARPIVVLFCAGVLISLGLHPKIPSTWVEWVAGVLLLSASLSFGVFISACLLRGAGGEVYRPRWEWLAAPPHFMVDRTDAVTLPSKDRAIIGIAVPASLATAAGIVAWFRPEWAFFPLIGLLISLRPIFGGSFAPLIRVGKRRGPSDAEHRYIFPPNRRSDERGRLLERALGEATTWGRIGYGVIWTFAVLYWGSRLGPNPPWTVEFWENNGIPIALGVGGSLALLAAGYVIWETYYIVRDSARAYRHAIGMWYRRWFGAGSIPLDESSRAKALASSPLFNPLQPHERQEIARTMVVRRYGPWKALSVTDEVPAFVSIIMSGKISLRREMPSGRTVQVQVLSEGDIIGLHDVADPKFPIYHLRTITPVTLLRIDRLTVEKRVLTKVQQSTLTDNLLKFPFLRQIPLCRNWHLQAINRFARLSSITSYPPGEVILNEGQTVEEFFVIFQGDARVTRGHRQLAVIHSGEFFGEIGLMQNSSPNASVTAKEGTRCLSIPRTELLRFVTHNYTVALELERVSSERLGRPIFPLRAGDFRPL